MLIVSIRIFLNLYFFGDVCSIYECLLPCDYCLDTVAEEDEGARRREVTDSEGYQSFFAVKQESFISCLLWV